MFSLCSVRPRSGRNGVDSDLKFELLLASNKCTCPCPCLYPFPHCIILCVLSVSFNCSSKAKCSVSVHARIYNQMP